MILCTLKLLDFRAHENSHLEFTPGINLIHGRNGAGKTNILEAAHYVCLSKNFQTGSDRHALRQGARFFEVEGTFKGTIRRDLVVRVAYVRGEGKRVFLNGAQLERKVDIIGLLPVVVIEPGVNELTRGSPTARRRFLNNILSQAMPSYMKDLMSYRRALRQRNELLDPNAHLDYSLLEPVTEILVRLGTRLVFRRLQFLNHYYGFLQQAWAHLGLDREEPSVVYQGFVSSETPGIVEQDIYEAFLQILETKVESERRRGRTCAGPHLDDLVLKLDGRNVRHFASTGQHRALAIALKLAQYLYLQDQLEETPLLLLDDLFDSLDSDRTRAILTFLQAPETGQSLITTANAERLQGQITAETSQSLLIEEGSVITTSPPAQ